MPAVHHRTVTVEGLEVFYREAGPAEAPVMLLLHGYPTSSHMFRHLIPALGDSYRVIAPDHIGFGRSSAPQVDDFEYTFDRLAHVTRSFLDSIGVTSFRRVHPGLRRTDRLASRRGRSGFRGRRDLPERQRL